MTLYPRTEGGVVTLGGRGGSRSPFSGNLSPRRVSGEKFCEFRVDCPPEAVIPMSLQGFCWGAVDSEEGGVETFSEAFFLCSPESGLTTPPSSGPDARAIPTQIRVPLTFFSENPFTTPLSATVRVKSRCSPASSPSASHHRPHASNRSFRDTDRPGPNSHSSAKNRSSTSVS